MTLFAVNRSLDEPMPLEVAATGFGTLRLHEALQLHHADLKAVNTKQDPDRVKPAPLSGVRIEGDRVYRHARAGIVDDAAARHDIVACCPCDCEEHCDEAIPIACARTV